MVLLSILKYTIKRVFYQTQENNSEHIKHQKMQCLIRIFNFRLQNVLLKVRKKINANTPKIGNRLIQPIRIGMLILLKRVNTIREIILT